MTDEEVFSPFVGLRSFEMDEEFLFFGREAQVDDLIRNLQKTRFLAVLGASGSGKSSLVRCGLIPSLFKGYMSGVGSKWRVAVFRPGNDPIGNLSRTLMGEDVFGGQDETKSERRRIFLETTLLRGSKGLIEAVEQNALGPRENLAVVVDQFEELFRFKRSEEQADAYDLAKAFVKLLLEAARQRDLNIFVVLTMRSDFLGPCTEFTGLPEAINSSQYLIPRLTRDQLKTAITGPVAVGEATISPQLVSTLLNTIGDNPDQLPVLQHALMRTWDYWAEHGNGDEPIDMLHYEAIGTMKEALSKHADEAFSELASLRLKGCAERIFQALTEKGEDGRGVRRPCTIEEISAAAGVSEAEIVQVADSFRGAGRCFLMPGADTVLQSRTMLDISHESLMRVWARLKTWVNEEAESATLYKQLASDAERHAKGERGLWRDPELAQALRWYKETHPELGWAKRYHPLFHEALEFLERSDDAQMREREDEELVRRKERWRAIRMASLSGFLILSLLILAGFTVLTGQMAGFEDQKKEMKKNFDLKRQDLRADVEGLKKKLEKAEADFHARRQSPPRRMLALGPKLKNPELSALMAVQAYRYQALKRGEDPRLDFSIHAELVASLKRLKVRPYYRVFDTSPPARATALSPNEVLVSGFQNGRVSIRYRNSFSELKTGSPVNGLALSMGNLDLAVSNKKVIHIWDLGSLPKRQEGQEEGPRKPKGPTPLSSFRGRANTMVFSQWSDALLFATSEQTYLWEYKKAQKPKSIIRSKVTSLAIGSDLLAAAQPGRVVLRHINKPETAYSNLLTRERLEVMVFSADGRHLAAGAKSGLILVWDLNRLEKKPIRLRGHTKAIRALDFKPRDNRAPASENTDQPGFVLASGGDDATIRIWNEKGKAITYMGHKRSVSFLSYLPGEKNLYSADLRLAIYTWSIDHFRARLCGSIQTRFGHDEWKELFDDLEFETPCE